MRRGPWPLVAAAALLLLASGAWAQTPRTFRDCPGCPTMVAVAAGTFMMGAPDRDGDSTGYERPQHEVRIAAFALGRTHVTRGEFARFVAATGYRVEPGCWYLPRPHNIEGHGPIEQSLRRSWRWPGFVQTDADPVVCVSYKDAEAYAAWLARRTRLPYRLPSEAEWEYAARAGATEPRTLRPGEACRLANSADLSWLQPLRLRPDPEHVAMCRDGYAFTAPGGRFLPNAFGLHDMYGNAAQWVADCLHENYVGAPADGSAWMEGRPRWVDTGECRFRVIRGNGWSARLHTLRVTDRGGREDDWRSYAVGMRVARSLP